MPLTTVDTQNDMADSLKTKAATDYPIIAGTPTQKAAQAAMLDQEDHLAIALRAVVLCVTITVGQDGLNILYRSKAAKYMRDRTGLDLDKVVEYINRVVYTAITHEAAKLSD